MARYEDFNKYNVAPPGTKQIDVYSSTGKRVGRIPLGDLAPPSGKKLYSFGFFADPHMATYNEEEDATAENAGELKRLAKLSPVAAEKAMKCFKAEGVSFVCIAGDLVHVGQNANHWSLYDAVINKNVWGIPVHAVTGNHEMMAYSDVAPYVRAYTGHGYDDEGKDGICYTFEYEGDVFIMLGAWLQFSVGKPPYLAYKDDSDVSIIKQVFEENRNRRCFVVQHPKPAYGKHSLYKTLPFSLYSHYKNITVFHGHTHLALETQTVANPEANYSEDLFRSIHIPALSEHEQGYIADVYEDGIHLRGVRFTDNAIESVPVGTYWISTPIVEIAEGTFSE